MCSTRGSRSISTRASTRSTRWTGRCRRSTASASSIPAPPSRPRSWCKTSSDGRRIWTRSRNGWASSSRTRPSNQLNHINYLYGFSPGRRSTGGRAPLQFTGSYSMKYLFATLLLGVSAASVYAQTEDAAPAAAAAAADAAPVVEVSSVKNPELKSYRQMLKGVDAFKQFHALAPATDLKFVLVADDSAVKLQDVTLRIAGDSTSIPVPLASDGTFTLEKIQAAVDDNADIVSNKKKNLLHWHADIRTPKVPENARRLGDLRLECEISWAVRQDEMSFFVRNGIKLAGGLCHSTHIMLHYQAPRALASVTLVSGDRREALTVSKKEPRVFMPPLSDTSWNDDALIEYEYADSKKL